MRKIAVLLIALVASIVVMATEGALPGKFTINAQGDQVVFSQGNLRYNGTWKFATNQWEYLGADQHDLRRDLFGWGTGKAPNKVTSYIPDYSQYSEWGANVITNGGNEANLWRTLTKDEWLYLFYGRRNAAKLFGMGSVNGVNGTILLPDNWTGALFTDTENGLTNQGYLFYYYNSSETNYSFHTYTQEQWEVMENDGAVFLPAAGIRSGGNVGYVGSKGAYWSASPYEDSRYAYDLYFDSGFLQPIEAQELPKGLSVRLVQAAPSSSTALDDAASTTKATKRIVNGHLLIEKNGKLYNATGAEIK